MIKALVVLGLIGAVTVALVVVRALRSAAGAEGRREGKEAP